MEAKATLKEKILLKIKIESLKKKNNQKYFFCGFIFVMFRVDYCVYLGYWMYKFPEIFFRRWM